jgi:PTH1 family peptidyl-tRNA hydrolase
VGNNYWRIRIGVGRPPEKSMVSSYVLGNFSEDEQEIMEKITAEISENISLLPIDPRQLEAKLSKLSVTSKI